MRGSFTPVPSDKCWPRFEEVQETVCKAYLEDGKNIHEIAHLHNLPLKQVRLIVSRAALGQQASRMRQEIMAEAMKAKLPLLREIVGLSLTTLRDFLENLVTDDDRKAALSIKDAKDLASIAKEIHEMARLELGQSTQNIEVVQRVEKDINDIIDELRVKDPFMDYDGIEPSAKPVSSDDNKSA